VKRKKKKILIAVTSENERMLQLIAFYHCDGTGRLGSPLFSMGPGLWSGVKIWPLLLKSFFYNLIVLFC